VTHPLIIAGAGVAGLWTALHAAAVGADAEAAGAIQGDPIECWFDVDAAETPREAASPEQAVWVGVSETLFEEAAQNLYEPSSLECSWVRLVGEVRVGLTHLSQASIVDSIGDLQREPGQFWYFQPDLKIMSFHDPQPEFQALDGARVELVGFLRNYCRQAYVANRAYQDANPDLIVWTSGYCHSSASARVELSDVRIISVETGPGRRVVGERNRGVAGDLDVAQLPGAVERALLEVAGLTLLDGPDPQTDESGVIGTRLSIHEGVARSPLNRFRSNPAHRPTQIFTPRPTEEAGDFADDGYFVACFCVERRCADRWPLTYSDALMLNAPYVCQRVLRHEAGSIVPW